MRIFGRYGFVTKWKVFSSMLLLLPVMVSAEPIQVTFIGNNQFQPTNIEWAQTQPGIKLRIFNLDEYRNLERELSVDLPVHDPDRATSMAKSRVAAIPQVRWNELFVGLLLVRQWGINRYPAVVFGDGQSVVYGVRDLQEAIEHWQAAGELLR